MAAGSFVVDRAAGRATPGGEGTEAFPTAGSGVRWTWAWTCLIAACVCALVALYPVLRHSGWPANHDALAPIPRMVAILGQWKAGSVMPIWSSQLQFGYGSPLPVLYHKTYMYLSAAVLQGTGSVKAALVVPLFVFVVAGFCGMCFCLKQVLDGRHPWLWMVGGTTFVFSNYFTTDWLVRGAFAEVSAMALIPWLFAWCAVLIGRGRWPAWIGVLLPLLALSHSTIALFSLIPLGVAFGLAALRWRSTIRSWLRPGALSVGMAVLIMLPFALPMVAMSRFNRIDQLTYAPYFTPRTNWWPLVAYLWNDAWTWGTSWRAYTVQLDLAPLVLFPVCIALVFRSAQRHAGAPSRLRWIVAFLVGMVSAFAWLQTSSAFWVYETVPGAQYLQFAWRLLAYLTTALILCACIALSRIAALPLRRPWTARAACVAVSVVLLAWTAWPKLAAHRLRFEWFAPIHFQEELTSHEYAALGEFLPLMDIPASRVLGDVVPDTKAELARLAAREECSIDRLIESGLPADAERRRQSWTVRCPRPSLVGLPVFLAPGMVARVRRAGEPDWREVPAERSCADPRLKVRLQAGDSEVQVRFPNWYRTAREAIVRGGFDFRRACGAARTVPS